MRHLIITGNKSIKLIKSKKSQMNKPYDEMIAKNPELQ
jgi:hypothetical protein